MKYPFQEVEKNFLKNKTLPPLLAMSGSDILRQGFFLKQLTEIHKKAILEKRSVDGLNVYELLDELNAPSLFHPQSERIVVVLQASGLKESEKILDAVKGFFKNGGHPWPGVLLILKDESLDGRKKLFQNLKKEGLSLEFAPLKPFEVKPWMDFLIEESGLKISAPVFSILKTVAEESLQAFQMELEKLQAFKGFDLKSEVTREDLFLVCGQLLKFEMAELVKAVVEGFRTRSLILAEHSIKNPEDALGFVGFLTWSLRNPERFKWSRVPNASRILKMTQEILQLDHRLKSANQDSRLLVDEFILQSTH